MVQRSPFHYRGCIGPEHEAAWEAMLWHNDLLSKIVNDLHADPPEYLSIVAPVEGGKTTLVRQLRERIGKDHPDILDVYLALGCLGPMPAEDALARYVPRAFGDRLAEVLELVKGPFKEAVLDVIREEQPESLEELEVFFRVLLPRLVCHRKVVLIIDELDDLPEELRNPLLRFFRALHQLRPITPSLRKLSVAILSNSPLEVKSLGATSPYNVAKEYRVPDFGRDDLDRFLAGCEGVLNGPTFTKEASAYLFEQTGGHAALIQRICGEALRAKAGTGPITEADILEGIAACYEKGDKFIATILNMTDLEPETMNVVRQLMLQEPVLPFMYLNPVAQLVNRGIAKKGPNNRVTFRSPLLRSLFVKRFASFEAPGWLTQTEEFLLKLPPVLVLLLNKPLQKAVRDRILPRLTSPHGDGPWQAAYQQEALEVLRRFDPPLDLLGTRFFYARYFAEYAPPQVDKDAVFTLVAKVFSEWAAQDTGGLPTPP